MRKLSTIAAVVMGLGCAAMGQTPSFRGLGFLPGGNTSGADAASSDGRVVAGSSNSSNTRPDDAEAYRWTAEGGMMGLGDFSSGAFLSIATDMTPDGKVIVGSGYTDFGEEAYRWTAETGMVRLGILPGYTLSHAEKVSHDGSVVAGDSGSFVTQGFEAFRWTQQEGMVGLGILPGYNGSIAEGMSADGSVIVGRTQGNGLPQKAFRWTADAGMQALGGDFASQAFGISSDGKTVVGNRQASNGVFAIAWRDNGDILDLGTLGANSSHSLGVSGDGSIIVGTSSLPGPTLVPTAFIWDQEHGMRVLQDVLTDEYGLDLTGWHLTNANWVSDDGRIFLGGGTDPQGNHQAWMAVLPEPALISYALAACGLLLRLRRRG